VNNLRFWIGVLALTCFAAGGGAGVWFGARAFRSEPAPGIFASYEEQLTRTFELSPERRRLLHSLLDAYRQDIDEIKDRRAAESMSAMEPELTERGRYYRSLIHDKVLPEARRAEFEHLASLTPTPR
jgi:hypothetical protein